MDDEVETVDQDLILSLQLQEYMRTGRLQRQLINDAMIPLQLRGRIVPLDMTRKIRMEIVKLTGIMLERELFELLEFFVDDLPILSRQNTFQGYHLDFSGSVQVLMVAGKQNAWLHFRDIRAGIYVTFFWHLSQDNPVRAIDQTYASVDEAIALILKGVDGIERGYRFVIDEDVTYPFPGMFRDETAPE